MPTAPIFVKPTINGSVDVWGEMLNLIIDQQDTFNQALTDSAEFVYLEDEGTANHIICDYVGYTAYTDGDRFLVKVKNTNTSAVDIVIQSVTPAKPITKSGGTALVANDIKADSYILLVYDGTNSRFELVGSGSSGTGNGFINLTDTSVTANTITCALADYLDYTDRDRFAIRVANTITGATNINIEGVGNKALKKACGSLAMETGEILEDSTILVEYNSTLDCFELLSSKVDPSSSKSIYNLTDTGTNNVIICAKAGYTTYTDRDRFSIKVLNSNTGNTSINIESVGAKDLKKFGGRIHLSAGDIKLNSIILVEYNATLDCFELLNSTVNNLNYYPDISGTVNTVTIASADSTYLNGRVYLVKIANTNTGTAIFSMNSVTKPIVKYQTQEPLVAGDLVQNTLVMFGYNGTNMQVLSGLKGGSGGGGVDYYTDVSASTSLIEITTGETSYTDGAIYLVKVANNLLADAEFKVTGLTNLVLKKNGITDNVILGDITADSQIIVSVNVGENVAQILSGVTSSGIDINSLTEKTTLVDDDVFLIEDSEDAYNKKKVKKSNVGGGGGLPSGIQGDMLYHNGTDWTKLSLGSSGQMLQASTTKPQWVSVDAVVENTIAVGIETDKILDSFSIVEFRSVSYEYVIFKGTGQRRSGVFYATWAGTGATVATYSTVKTTDIGTINITLGADVVSGMFRFKATGTTSDWTVAFKRTTINGVPQVSGRGLFVGGTTIEYITISTTGNSANFGSKTNSYMEGCCASETRALFAGGGTNDAEAFNLIQYVSISTLSNAVNFGTLSRGKNYISGTSNSVRGLFGGGGYFGVVYNDIDYVTIATTNSRDDFGDLTVARYGLTACSNTSKALFIGGYNTVDPITNIDSVEISTLSNASSFGDLTNGLYFLSACANSTYGFVSGGSNGSIAVKNIQKITIASFALTSDWGELILAKSTFASFNNPTRGIFGGGAYGTDDYSIEYIDLTGSGGNTSNFGNLQSIQYSISGTSNSHGGIA